MSIISPSAKKSLKANKTVRLERAIGKNLVAVLSFKPFANDKIRVRGFLKTQDPLERVTAVKEIQGTATGFASLEATAQNLCNSLKSRFDTLSKPTTTTHRSNTTDFATKVLTLPNIMDPANFAPYVKQGWAESTASNAVSYYAHTIGAFYDEVGEDADANDFEAFRASEVDRIYKQKYTDHTVEIATTQARRDASYNTLNNRMASAAAVQKYLLATYPGKFPEFPIPVTARTTARGKEKVKAITMEQYITLCSILKILCIAQVPYAFAVLLELLCGCRIGESCAPLIGDFQIFNGFGRYYVDHQIDSRGNRTSELKNEYSYRYVFFGNFFIELLQLRKQQLSDAGYTMEEMNALPFASDLSTPTQFLQKTKASSFMRALLALVGCDADWLEAQAAKMYAQAAAAGNGEDLDVCAHTLRSTIATFTANGGIDALTVDAVLGHKNEKNRGRDYATLEVAQSIAAKMERAIYLGSLCNNQTLNPAYGTVAVQPDNSYHLDGNMRYRFSSPDDVDLFATLNLESLEPGSFIKIRVPKSKANTANPFSIRPIPFVTPNLSTRPILQPLVDEQLMEGWIQNAKEIDLTDIIRKYGGIA